MERTAARPARMPRATWTRAVLDALATLYPDAATELHYQDPFQLLCAVVLSAQTTDVRVNLVTPALFARFPDARALAAATPEEIEPFIATVGLFRNKARHLAGLGRLLVERHDGQVPPTREALEALPGVGRKTANVVLSCAFDEPAIAVDTHVFRVSNRIGLADADDVRATEAHLMAAIPREKWAEAHHWLILHGRRVCAARKPACERCPLETLCVARLTELGAQVPPWSGRREWEG